MNTVQLKPGVFWVGAVDFNMRNFHHYSRSPLGTTYNAYLVRDEKTVLFDTVSHKFGDELIRRIEAICPLEEIDYIVANHLEKDHSAVLPRMIQLCRPEKVFCSVMGQKSMSAMFDVSGWPVQVVRDGERLNIGRRNITFLETRMLHWPDSMVSFIEEDKILISQDAFGQNIASSRRYADEFDRPLILQAMKDYYNNIILPYSPLVLKTLERLVSLNLGIEMIAPDHGLIFRQPDDIKFVLQSYHDFAAQKPGLEAVIAYDTMWSATEKMAEAVAEGLGDAGVPYVLLNLQDNHPSMVLNALADCGALILGSATRNNQPMMNMSALLTNLRGLKPRNKVGGSFGAYGWSGEAPKMLYDELKAMEVQLVGEPVRALFSPGPDDLAKCRELGKQIAQALKEKIASFA